MKPRRPASQRTKSDLVAVWMPKELKQSLDVVVQRQDLDRSKFIRAALREKLERSGLGAPTAA